LSTSAVQELLKSQLKIVSLEQFLKKFKIGNGMQLQWQIVAGQTSGYYWRLYAQSPAGIS